MNSREQTLAVIVLGAMVASVGAAGGYFFILKPLSDASTAEATVGGEITALEEQLDAQTAAAKKLREARSRGLPADEALARSEYLVALERMIEASGIKPGSFTVTPKTADGGRGVPELTKGKPIYNRVACVVTFKHADAAALARFLRKYYQFGLLHQITDLEVKREEDHTKKGDKGEFRDDLTVTFTTEAIIVDGGENRKTLLPVPPALAAAAGGALQVGAAAAAETGRGFTARASTPTLTTLNRDYDLIVRKDPFHGPLIDTPPPPFKLAALRDVKVKPDEKHDPIKVTVSGDGSVGATVTAVVSGSLYAEGALPVEKNAIHLPRTSATEGTATVTVIATSGDGVKTEKASFKVSVAEPDKATKAEPKEDISGVIILTGTAPRSDGTAWAQVFDNANRLRYTIEAKPTGVHVMKEWFTRQWKKDTDYDHPPGVLAISDDDTGTKRTFRVIAVDIDGLIVADLKPDGAGHEHPKARPGGGPPRGGFPGGTTKQGHANPLAAVGGNMIAAIPPVKYYRWPVGQPLKDIKLLKEDEAKKIQKLVEAAGPVFDVATVVP
jgi:hypothetical protein